MPNDTSPPFKIGTRAHPRPTEPTAGDKIETHTISDNPSQPFFRKRGYTREAGYQPPSVPNVQQGERNDAPGAPLGRK